MLRPLPRTSRPALVTAAVAAALTVALGGCGGDDGAPVRDGETGSGSGSGSGSMPGSGSGSGS